MAVVPPLVGPGAGVSASPVSTDARLRVTYALACAPGEDPAARARDIALEQTVELPPACVDDGIARAVVGRVEELASRPDGRWRAVVSYDAALVGGAVAQLVNLLFGNISLKAGILVTQVAWPEPLLRRFPGPRFGIDGVRAACGTTARRPLLCAVLKPVGLSPPALAALCYQFALGGVDLVKDDHSLADQATAPFAERVAHCQDAVARANAVTGGTTLYVPNLAQGAPAAEAAVALARAHGCRALLASPLLVGLDTVRWLAETSGLVVLAHPALAGAFFGAAHGIVPEVLLGQLFRLVGADAVIYPNAGGRFTLSPESCDAINEALRRPLGPLRPAFPVPAGGVDVARVPHWVERYGPDTIFLIGGSLYAQRDLARATRRLVDALAAYAG
jgi:ribulose-bisphosphate carboxylase large chain